MIDELAIRRQANAARAATEDAFKRLIASLDAIDVAALAFQPPCYPNCRCVATFDETKSLGDGPVTIEARNLAPARRHLWSVP